MRTLPTAYTNGLSAHSRMFYLLVVEGSGGNTYYWPTAGRNRDGNALTLKATSGGGALSYDAGMIAEEIDGQTIDGIGQFESSIDISRGGGVESIGDLVVTILNQARFDSDILSGGINLEHRPVTLYEGFIPAGSTPTVVIADDLIKLWSGIVAEVMDFDYSGFELRCTDATPLRHKDIPTTLVTQADYPRAPKESLGKPLPLLYGDWAPADEEAQRKVMTLSAAPTVLVDDVERKFVMADHALHTQQTVFIYSKDINVLGKTTATTFDVASAPSFIDFSASGLVEAEFYVQLKTRGGATKSGLEADFPNAVDEDLANSISMNSASGTTDEMYGQVNVPNDVGELVDFYFVTQFGTITGTIEMAKKDSPYTSFSGGGLGSGNSDSEVSTVALEEGVGGIASIKEQYGVNVSVSPPGTAQVKNMYLKLNYQVANFAHSLRDVIRIDTLDVF